MNQPIGNNSSNLSKGRSSSRAGLGNPKPSDSSSGINQIAAMEYTNWGDNTEWMKDIFNDEHLHSPSASVNEGVHGSINHQTHFIPPTNPTAAFQAPPLPSNPPFHQSKTQPFPPNRIQPTSNNPPSHHQQHHQQHQPMKGKSSNYEKKKVSDAITYGPRFITIYNTYCKQRNKKIDITKHLFVLCLEHLIDFIQWSRENENQIKWLNELLYENDYLRPEVRNGIVMVLIYTFASIKATIIDGADMFSTLQDMEKGLGIANKFSLKIYNDPLNYLNFLKFCISSLIDAGAIPDNERQQQNQIIILKKTSTKSMMFSNDEVNAYYMISKHIIDLIQVGNLTEAKNIVQIITTHWQLRGKNIRAKRFASALEVISQPNLADISQREYQQLMQQVRDGLNPGNSISAPTLPPAYTMEASHIIDEIRDELSENETQPIEEDQYDELDENDDDLGEGDSFSKGSSKKRKRNKLRNSESDEDKSSNSIKAANFHRYNVLAQQQYVQDNVYNPNSYVDNSSGSITFNPMNSLTQIYSHPTAVPSVVPSNYPQTISSYLPFQPPSGVTSGVVLASTPTALSNPPMIQQQQQQTRKLPFTLRVLRFERIGLTEWDIKETRVFDIPQFIQSLLYLNSSSSSSTSGTSSSSSSLEMNLYLLNEKKLNKMLADKKCSISVSSGKGSGGGIGMISLENELNQLQSILTHWPKYEIMQFQHFLSSYETSYLQYTSDNISNNNTGNSFTLFQYWNQLDESHSSAINDQPGDSTGNGGKEVQAKSGGNQSVIGYIAYEITVYLVLIIRKNLSLGIHNDIWCKIFPNELIHANEEIRQDKILKRNKVRNQSNSTTEGGNDDEFVVIVTFGEILINFFPQLSYIIKKLRQQSHNNNNNPNSTSNNTIPFEESDLLIKYYCINTLNNNSNNTKINNNSNNTNNSNSNSLISNSRNNVNNGGGSGSKESNLVSDFTVPNMVSDNCYQTIGTFNTPANKVMARMLTGACIHDFILELVS